MKNRQCSNDKKIIIDLHLGITKNIVFQLCLTDQLFALAFQFLKIIDLLPIHISPYLAQPCPAVVLQIIFLSFVHCLFLHV